MKRPTINNSTITTPSAATMIELLGSGYEGQKVVLSRDEFRALQKLYGFRPEEPNAKPPPPPAPNPNDFSTTWKYEQALNDHKQALQRHAKWEDPMPFMQAGADRNAIRYAEADGLRIVAWLARFIPQGEDPLKHLISLAGQAGWDLDPEDLEWAESD